MKVFTVTTTQLLEDALNGNATVHVTASKEEARKLFKEEVKFQLDCIKGYDDGNYCVDFEEDDEEMETATRWNGQSEDCPSDYETIIVLQEHEI